MQAHGCTWKPGVPIDRFRWTHFPPSEIKSISTGHFTYWEGAMHLIWFCFWICNLSLGLADGVESNQGLKPLFLCLFLQYQILDEGTWRKQEDKIHNKSPASVELLNAEEALKFETDGVRNIVIWGSLWVFCCSGNVWNSWLLPFVRSMIWSWVLEISQLWFLFSCTRLTCG